MKKLYFVSSWPDMKTAWSGTPMGLYTALSKRLDVTLVDGCQSKGKQGQRRPKQRGSERCHGVCPRRSRSGSGVESVESATRRAAPTKPRSM